MTAPPPLSPSPPDPAAKTARADAHHAARGGAIQILGAIAQVLMPVYHMLVGRLFGQATLGLYSGALAVTEVLTRFGLAGGDKSMHRFIASHHAAGEDDLEKRALGHALRLSLLFSAPLALLAIFGTGLLARWSGRDQLAVALPAMAPAIVAAPLLLIFVAATLGRKVARMSLYLRGLVEPGLLMLAAGVAYLLGQGARGLGVAHGIAYLAIAALAALACARVFGGRWFLSALGKSHHPGLVRFALPVAASELANAVFQRTDMMVLPLFVPPEQVAAYFAAEFLGRIAANVRYAFDGIAGPVLSEALALKDRQRLTYNFRLFTRWVATLSFPLATTMIALRTDLLSLYGPGFRIAGTIVIVHTVGHLLSGVLGQAGAVIMMAGRARLVLANQVGAAALNLALCLLLVPRLGILGAAFAVVLALGAMIVAMLVEVALLERVHPFHAALVKPLFASVACLCAQLATAWALDLTALRVLATVATGIASYLAMLLLLGLGAEEKDIARSLLARLRSRAPGGG